MPRTRAKGPLGSIYDSPEVLKNADATTRIVLDAWWKSETELVDPERDKWEEHYRMYRSYSEIDDDRLLSNFSVPATWAHIESYCPRVVANNPRIEVWPSESNDAALAAMHRALIFYDWRLMKLPFWLVPYVKSALVFSMGVFRVRHKREVGKKAVRVTDNFAEFKLMMLERIRGLQPGTLPRPIKFESADQVLYDDPVLEPWDIDRFYPHPDARSIEDAPWAVFEEPGVPFSTIEGESKGNEDLYDPAVVEELKKLIKDRNPLERYSGLHRQHLKERQLETFGPEMVPTPDEHGRDVTLLTYQSKYKTVTIVKEFPELRPLRNQTNRVGMIEAVTFTPIPDPMYSFYGMSLAEVLFSLNLESNSLRNARMDRILGAIYPMFSAIRGSGQTTETIRWRPWGVQEMDDHDDLRAMQLPEINLSAYREAAEIDSWMQKVAAPDSFMGFGGPNAETATEASMLFQSAGSKAGLMYHILSHQALERMGRLLIRNNELYKSRPQVIQVTGRDMPAELLAQRQANLRPGETAPGQIQVNPLMLSQGFGSEPDLLVDVANTEPETRQFRLQRMVNALQTLGQIPVEAMLANPLLKEIAISMGEALNIDHARELIEQMTAGASPEQAIQQLMAQQGGAGSQAEVRPETEGDRLAQDQGGSGGPRPF